MRLIHEAELSPADEDWLPRRMEMRPRLPSLSEGPTSGPDAAMQGAEGAAVRGAEGAAVLDLDVDSMDEQELQVQLDNLMKAVTVINHLAVSLDINAALESVQKVALEMLDCDRVTMFLVFDRLMELRAKGHDQSGQHAHLIKVKFGEGIAGQVASSGQLMNVPDAYTHPLFNSTVDKDTGYQTRNLLCCAIRDMSGRNVAVLQALNKRGNMPFSMADERNLELFGMHLGNTLAKARLHEQAEREKHRLSALFNCFKVLSTAGNLGQVVELATQSVREVLHAEYAFIFIMDAPRRELWMQCREASGEVLSVRVRQGEGLVGRCGVDHAEPFNCVNISDSGLDDDQLLSQVRGWALAESECVCVCVCARERVCVCV